MADLEFRDCTLQVVREGDRLELKAPALQIEVVAGADAGTVATLAGPEGRIGSGAGCDLVLHDAKVSRQHLLLRLEEGRIRVIDLESKNGTRVDGIYVRDAWARPESVITAGGTSMRLRVSRDLVAVPLSLADRFGGLLGNSTPMRRLFAILERVAPTDATVLVEGETGTGKELVAEGIHEESPRAAGPFVVFDCSAVAPTLIESELFGHVRGAFTGATGDRAGAFEQADGGTLFIDEIGELPLDLQPKLLRALERREVRRVGATESRTVDVRIVAATNRALALEVERGGFREDLYYRLAVITVKLPPLRERPEDIPRYVAHFVKQLAGAGHPGLDEAQLKTLSGQAWPGNVRELKNAVERILSIGVEPASSPGLDLAAAIDLSVPLKTGRERVSDAYERLYLQKLLEKTGGNVSRAAELAGVNRRFVQRAMKRYGLRGA